MKKTYQGGCHCGAVRFECELDLAEGTSKCNCSICRKSRFWKAVVPAAELRLGQGREALTEYTFGSGSIRHLFCARCGIKPFGQVHLEGLGGEFYAVNVACLDDATDEELAAARVRHEDGRNNNWDSPPGETRYL